MIKTLQNLKIILKVYLKNFVNKNLNKERINMHWKNKQVKADFFHIYMY